MNYSIPEWNIESLEKKLTRIRNKCAKYGCEFKYERIGEHFEEIDVVDDQDENGRVIASHKEVIKFIDIDVEGVAAVNGWQFAASLEYTDKGNIIKGVEGLEIPERYYDCHPWCEHCKTSRDRKYSYIVYKAETGEFKQVGKACLKDFTGGLSAEAVAQFESYIKECEEASDWRSVGCSRQNYFSVKDYARYVAETIRVYGYVKSGYAEYSTKDRARDLLMYEDGYRIPEWVEKACKEAISHGFDSDNEESKKLAENVLNWISEVEDNSNYYHNLKVACALEYCGYSGLGLIASAFPAYNRELEYEAERKRKEEEAKKAAANSSWLGNVGDKISFKIADCSTISSWETQWGITHVYKLKDDGGRECTWKTSNWLDENCVGKIVKATIKELKEFRGIKQTEITRARIN